MKTLFDYISEAQSNNKNECTWFDAFQNKFVSGSREDMGVYSAKFAAERPNHFGTAPKDVDPDNLLKDAICTWGSERTKEDLIVVIDKKHPDYYFGSCKAIIFVDKIDDYDYEKWRELKKKYPVKDYYIVTGCAREVKDGKDTIKVFDMYLS